jgi:probable addiction module antidote protein
VAFETTVWDPADHLDSSDAILAYVDVTMEDGDPELIAAVLGDVARMRGR